MEEKDNIDVLVFLADPIARTQKFIKASNITIGKDKNGHAIKVKDLVLLCEKQKEQISKLTKVCEALNETIALANQNIELLKGKVL